MNNNMYKAEPYMAHADYTTYRLTFGFEDWSGIIDDGNEHLYMTAEYMNADDCVLVKFQDEDFDSLLLKLKEWDDKHRITI